MTRRAGAPAPARAHLIAIAVLVAGAVGATAAFLAHRSERLAGTNSISAQTWITPVNPGQRLCVRDLRVPRGSAGVQLRLLPAGAPVDVRAELRSASGVKRGAARLDHPAGEWLDFRLEPAAREEAATLCVVPDGPLGGVGGSIELTSERRPQAFLGGEPLPSRIAVYFLEPGEPTTASMLDDAARRASVFKPGFVGPWLFALLPLLVAALTVAALRRLVREAAR